MSSSESKSQTFLVTGATGKTGRRTVAQLRASGHTARAASRNPRADHADNIKFDWNDATSFGAALDGVDGVYMVAPGGNDPMSVMAPFFEVALEKGVRRFVLLSSYALEKGDAQTGKVHEHMAGHCAEWVVLRPNWFAQNLSEVHLMVNIPKEKAIYSCAGEGRIALVDCDDIASCACAALTMPSDSPLLNNDYVLSGGEALTYTECAATISDVVGFEVKYVYTDQQGVAKRFMDVGVPGWFADILAGLDASCASGAASHVTNSVKTLTGNEPRTFRQFAEAAKEKWVVEE